MRLLFVILLLIFIQYMGLSQVPGGITSSPLKLWFKSDLGVSASGSNVSTWSDVSGQNNVTTHPTKTPNPSVVYKPSEANYNPTVYFDGTRLERLKGSANNMGGIPTLFTVSRSFNTANFNPIFSNMEINPTVPDPNAAKETGPGLFIYFDSYVVDANSAWIPFSADAPAFNNQLDIITSIYGSATSTANSEIYQNGVLKDLHTGATMVVTPGKQTIEIGGRSGDDAQYPGRIFNGDIAEIVYFNNRLSAIDCQRVETYLAVKYGITLEKNYLSSNFQTIYDVSSFGYRIIGIGRDDASGLSQKQSKGENFTSVLQIGLSSIASSNALNNASFSSDRTYLITGDDNQNLIGTTVGVPSGFESWLLRKWKLIASGSPQSNIVFQIPATVVSSIPGNGEVSIVFSDNNLFSNGVNTFKMNLTGNLYTAVIPQIQTGTKYFTFAKCLKPSAGTDITVCTPTTSFDFPDANPHENWRLIDAPPNANPAINGSTGSVVGLGQSGVYSFSLDNTICECSDTVSLIKGIEPIITSITSNTPLCEGDELNLIAVSSINNYTWIGPNGFQSMIANPRISGVTSLNAGTYTVTSKDFNCSNSQSVVVTINGKPVVSISGDTTICTETSIPLFASGGSNYIWTPSIGLSASNISNPTATVSMTTTYLVQVFNSSGCKDSAEITIYVDQSLCDGIIYFPSAFTPNANGINDQFKALNGFSTIKDYELKIYNRWGQLVFITKNPQKGWDGKFKSVNQDGNIFVWFANYTMRNGKKFFKKGTVLLVR